MVPGINRNVQSQYLSDSFMECLAVVDLPENNNRFVNQNPKCERQLGKRGIYRTVGGESDGRINELAMLWILNMSDGNVSLLDIADRSDLDFRIIKNAAAVLLEHNLLKEVGN
jgi:aminopeptidase-like protein